MSAPETIEEVLARLPLGASVPANAARAAAIAVLRRREAEVEVLLLQRTERAEDPASGHIALPGGRVDSGDPSLEATALREMEEEVGLTAEDLAGPPRFAGLGAALQSRVTVGVFAAEYRNRGRAPRCASPNEVAEVFWMPRSRLLPTESVPRQMGTGLRPVDATVFQGHILWGFTRRALLDLFALGAPGAVPPRAAPFLQALK